MLGNLERDNTCRAGWFCFSILCVFCVVAHADDVCGSGYTVANSNDLNITSFMRPVDNECDFGYSQMIMNHDLWYPVPLDAVSRCPLGQFGVLVLVFCMSRVIARTDMLMELPL